MIRHEDIAELGAAEKLLLIAELWDSLSDADAPLPQAQNDEVLRRLSTFESDKAQAVSWEALKSELGARQR